MKASLFISQYCFDQSVYCPQQVCSDNTLLKLEDFDPVALCLNISVCIQASVANRSSPLYMPILSMFVRSY